MNLSFWEYDSFFSNIDFLVIGSGIVGLNAAISLKKRAPSARVVILERGTLPIGASTRNAGFACFGSMTELMDDLSRRPGDEVLELVRQRWEGLRLLKARLGSKDIGYEESGGIEVFSEGDRQIMEESLDRMSEMNAWLKTVIGEGEVFRNLDKSAESMGMAGVTGMIINVAEGQIHTGKMMQQLLSLAREQGVEIFNGLGISSLEDRQGRVEVMLENGWEISAPQVLIATNGFARRLIPRIDVQPARNQVLVTEPVDGLKLKGCFHYRKGYVYFRNIGNRILIGGARDLDFEGETTDEFGFSDIIQEELHRLFRTLVIPGRDYRISHGWSGIMGTGEAKKPVIERISPGVTVSVRLGGMGVAIGAAVGEAGALTLLET